MIQSSEQRFPASPIRPGFEWRQLVRVLSARFDPDAKFIAQVRVNPADPEVLAALMSSDGSIQLQGSNAVVLVIRGDASANWPSRITSVVVDVVRTDTVPPQHLGFRLRVPVTQSVTRL